MSLDAFEHQSESAQEILEGKGFGIRALAFTIDSWIFTFFVTLGRTIGGVALLISRVVLAGGEDFPPSPTSMRVLGVVLTVVTGVVYFVLYEWLFGATPGKLVTGLRVVSRDGSRVTLASAFIRGFLRFVDAFLFGAIAFYEMRRTPLRLRFGDRVADTVVVRNDHPAIADPRPLDSFAMATALFLAYSTIVTAGFVLVN